MFNLAQQSCFHEIAGLILAHIMPMLNEHVVDLCCIMTFQENRCRHVFIACIKKKKKKTLIFFCSYNFGGPYVLITLLYELDI